MVTSKHEHETTSLNQVMIVIITDNDQIIQKANCYLFPQNYKRERNSTGRSYVPFPSIFSSVEGESEKLSLLSALSIIILSAGSVCNT